jgi:hypothetical protein
MKQRIPTGMTTRKAKAKYGGLSTAAAKCAASGRDDAFLVAVERAVLYQKVERAVLYKK